MEMICNLKKGLRMEMRKRLFSIPKLSLLQESYDICSHITQSELLYKRATHVCLFSPLSHEVQILNVLHKALEDKKYCYVPVVQSDSDMGMYRIYSWKDYTSDFEPKGKYKIWEPKDLHTRDTLFDNLEDDSQLLIVIPGLAFDLQGERLGYGGGYYDRYLKKLFNVINREQVTVIAPALQTQLLDCIPSNELDVPVDVLITRFGVQKALKSCYPKGFHVSNNKENQRNTDFPSEWGKSPCREPFQEDGYQPNSSQPLDQQLLQNLIITHTFEALNLMSEPIVEAGINGVTEEFITSKNIQMI